MTHLGFVIFAQEEKHLISPGRALIHPCCLSSTSQTANTIYKLTRKADQCTGDVWKEFFFGISRSKLLFLC